jgi:hypothetical protein
MARWIICLLALGCGTPIPLEGTWEITALDFPMNECNFPEESPTDAADVVLEWTGDTLVVDESLECVTTGGGFECAFEEDRPVEGGTLTVEVAYTLMCDSRETCEGTRDIRLACEGEDCPGVVQRAGYDGLPCTSTRIETIRWAGE